MQNEQLVIEITPPWCEENGIDYKALLAVIFADGPLSPNESD